MTEYIKREDAIKALDKGLWGKDWDKALAEAIISDIPSADVAEVVRCKECRNYRTRDDGTTCCVREFAIEGWNADDFCSYGERKDNE